MKDVLKIMDRDHEELADMFTQFILNVNSNSEKSINIFSRLKQHLLKHFQWEEKVLFPLFEERTGTSGLDTIFVLKNEHLQINTMFISKIELMLSESNYPEIALLAVGLEEMLSMHRQYENDIFYPWFDDSLDEAERIRVLKLLKAREDK
jgi:iron-sulfur cluster repair protein YtfE (RIC family)